MELHQLVKSIRAEMLLAEEKVRENPYWEGRYSLAKQLLREVEPYKKHSDQFCMHCTDKQKDCSDCF
ncbi:hypothetical protein [Lysinibacillus antri]|uniref:Uncharacterized protein n=1 Tax=Lysinibacillus antri TaxID=2498145 RepID=A0A3S0QQ32_9BACI|nr:hypothetical protein [Lysinibacillus antri]RUL53207.1 hypothetical protein EK386_09605 [Lysinibacillus antri]